MTIFTSEQVQKTQDFGKLIHKYTKEKKGMAAFFGINCDAPVDQMEELDLVFTMLGYRGQKMEVRLLFSVEDISNSRVPLEPRARDIVKDCYDKLAEMGRNLP